MRTALLIATVAALPILVPAQAQTLSVNISASVQFPGTLQTAASVLSLLSQGVQVTFLTSTSQPAASLGSGGGIVVRPAYSTSTRITQVQVMTPVPNTTTYVREIYPLAQPVSVSAARALTPQSIVVRGRDGTRRALTAVMGRQAAWAKAPGLQKKPAGLPPGQYKKQGQSKK